jgi:riboflavin kinase/FMN adenylyltransferase
MKVIRDLDWLPEFDRGTAVTWGEFDGVHRGHRVVLLETLRTSVVEGCPTVVVTFDARAHVDAASAPPMLTEFEYKLELFAAAEVDYVIRIPDNRIPRSNNDDDDDPGIKWIVDDVLIDTLKARAVVIGEEYQFGSRRQRTIDTVRARAEAGAFRVVQIPVDSRTTTGGEVISAQTIRAHLAAGGVELAAEMLGRPHEVRAVVTAGERRGRTIGFPTLNLPLPDHVLVPAEGVYAGRYIRENGERYRAAINVGRRPTFHEQAPALIEAHLLDFRGDLYGERGRLQFLKRLRPEEKFDGIDALKAQLAADVAAVRAHMPYG